MNLPIILIGGGLLYVLLNKKSSTNTNPLKKESNSTQSNNSNVIGSKEIGYTIQNCQLTIYDSDKALEYAFEQGRQLVIKKSLSANELKIKLIGDCLSTIQKRTCLFSSTKNAHFIFDLIRYGYSGAYSEGAGTIMGMTQMLKDFISDIKKEFKSIDTSNWTNELVEIGK